MSAAAESTQDFPLYTFLLRLKVSGDAQVDCVSLGPARSCLFPGKRTPLRNYFLETDQKLTTTKSRWPARPAVLESHQWEKTRWISISQANKHKQPHTVCSARSRYPMSCLGDILYSAKIHISSSYYREYRYMIYATE